MGKYKPDMVGRQVVAGNRKTGQFYEKRNDNMKNTNYFYAFCSGIALGHFFMDHILPFIKYLFLLAG